MSLKMISRILILLEYGAYPVWLYDENGNIIGTRLPEEFSGDTKLDAMFVSLQARYESAFINDGTEFAYCGFSSEKEKEQFLSDWDNAVLELRKKLREKYEITERKPQI